MSAGRNLVTKPPISKVQELQLLRDNVVNEHSKNLFQFPDVKLSWWGFSTYQKCPQQFIMNCTGRRYDGRDDSYWAIGGSVVHGLMEDFVKAAKEEKLDFTDKNFLLDNAAARYDLFVKDEFVDWQEHRVDPVEHRKLVVPGILKSLDWIYDELHRLEILPCDPASLFPEFSFKTRMTKEDGETPLPILLTGRVDLVKEHPDQLEVIDFKDVAKRGNVAWRQLVWYPIGIEPLFNKKVSRSGFALTSLKDWIWKRPDQVNGRDARKRTFRQILREEMLETALNIRREQFSPKISRHHCHYCPAKRECPAFYQYAGQEAELMAELENLNEGRVNL